jgi:type II secretory pathway component GspD/PulD (secretin)
MNSRLASVALLASFFMFGTLFAQQSPPPQQAPQQQPRPRRVTAEPAAAGPLVTLEVLLIDHNAAIGGKEGAAVPSAAEFVKLHKEGKLERAVRVQLASVAGNPARVQIGERVPVAIARNASGFGGRGGAAEGRPVSYAYNIQDIGTLINAATRVEEGGAVLVDLQVERSHLAPSERPADEPQDEIARQKTVSLTSQSTLRLKPGEPAIAEGWQSTSGQDTNGVFIVVTATVEKGGPARAAAAERDAGAQLQVFVLGNVKAGEMHRVLQQVFGDSAIRISVDEANNRIVVYAPQAQLDSIRELIQVLDTAKK